MPQGPGYGQVPPGFYEWFPHDKFPKKYQTGGLETLVYLLNNRARAELGIPGMFGIAADGSIFLTPAYANAVGHAFQINLANIVIKTVMAAQDHAVDSMTLLAQALLLGDTNKHVERANKQLAAEMRKALMHRYGQSVERRKQVPSYARANRLSGNLRRAISQPDMAVGSAAGISYINQDRLNVEARHWRRINFGVRGAAGARGSAQSKAPEQFDILSTGKGGRSAGRIGFRSDVRPPMYLPPGFWEFIGGRASAATDRVGRVHTTAADDQESMDERVARRMAERRARMGGAAVSGKATTASTTGGKITGISNMYSRRLNRQSGTSSWGADVGGYPRTRSYERTTKTRMVGPAPGGGVEEYTQTQKRKVTSTIRGVRRSRQSFHPTRKNAMYPTRGVVAANFMDAGFRALRDNVDRVYFQMAQNMLQEAADTAEGKALRDLLVKHKVSFPGLGGTYQESRPGQMGGKRKLGYGPSTA